MKKMICLWMLASSITGVVCAQEKKAVTNEDKTFELPANKITRSFWIELDKGNKMQVELVNIDDLEQVGNVDSLVRMFLQDLAPLKDSLSDELSYKRIDYVTDTKAKKIRIYKGRSNSNSYLIQRGEVAALKLEQDTIHFLGKVNNGHPYRFSFFVNNWNELAAYADGRLNDKLHTLGTKYNTDWMRGEDGRMHLTKDYLISAKQSRGYLSPGGDQLELNAAASIQNYKNYFVPGFSLGGAVIASSIFHNKLVKHVLGVYWEPNFFFGKDSDGKARVYRNDFLTLVYGQGAAKQPGKKPDLTFTFSLGYLIHREGDYMAPHTFRIGMGRMSLFEGKTKVEPLLYFNDFFKGVTPGIRLIQYF
ncbi:hypothetical protein SAMN04488505_1011420 [Chitinophaga rupis]|uniref:Uncharacterized protein n=1 Tax=Chitinophaga rupis TaxID=573321 RepID=A0A1H7M844_9BACT|nr:hypothetical protein [Chitinophaga rupis]SEL06905.1 hypothetical protein SAMN04488505_1011420 [Chitinophaga rupis]